MPDLLHNSSAIIAGVACGLGAATIWAKKSSPQPAEIGYALIFDEVASVRIATLCWPQQAWMRAVVLCPLNVTYERKMN